jgi:hypothetical protein
MMLPLLPLLLQILFLVLVTSYGRYLVILGERRRKGKATADFADEREWFS